MIDWGKRIVSKSVNKVLGRTPAGENNRPRETAAVRDIIFKIKESDDGFNEVDIESVNDNRESSG